MQNFDDVIVSLDGPQSVHDKIRRVEGAFARTRAGIEQIRNLIPKFPIAGRCTIQRENAGSLLDTWRAAHEITLDSISFLAADMTSDAFNRRPGQSPDIAPTPALLEREIENLIATGECGGFICESPTKLKRIAAHFRSENTAPLCNAPWVSAVVEANGTVRPCFFHAPIGRVTATNTLANVINGPQAVAFRAQLDVATNPTCKRCVCSLNLSTPLVHSTQS